MTELRPLFCDGCGAAVTLTPQDSVACRACGARVALPPAYVQAAKLLASQVEARRRSEPHWVALQRPTRRAFIAVGAALVLLLPPAATALLVLLDDGAKSLVDVVLLAALPALAPGGAMMMITVARSVTGASLALALSARPPEVDGGAPRCRHCGAPLEVAPDAIGASCGYCATDSIVGEKQLSNVRGALQEQIRTLEQGIARLRARRRLSWLGVASAMVPIALIGWLIRWALG